MKNSTLKLSLLIFLAAIMLSGCMFPYWDDEGGGHRGGWHHGGGHGEGGHREGGERR